MKLHHLGCVASTLLALAGLSATGCKKDEPPPPLPSAQPVTTAPAPLQLKPEDAGVKPPADAGAKKVVHGGGGHAGGLGPCCAALSQNANLAPEPTKTYMLQAAAMCSALAAQGRDKAAVGGILLGALRGAGMPASCR
jgi:hypothetical protein